MLSLFEDVQLVEGALRSVLYDLSRGSFHFIPDVLARVIKKYDKKLDFEGFEDKYHPKYQEQIKEFYSFLIDNDLIFDIDGSQIEFFKKMDFDFEYPFELQNIVVSISIDNLSSIEKLINIGTFSMTKNVAFIVDGNVEYSDLHWMLTFLYKTTLVCSEIRVKSGWKNYEDDLNKIKVGLINVNYLDDPIIGENPIEDLLNKFPKLSSNIIIHTESQKYHTYFNKKLYIGKNGEIKNAYELADEYGKIDDIESLDDLRCIISKSEFQKYWSVNKDSCCVCKDCELRYMCVDNRIPYLNRNGNWFHKDDCSYNPYIAKWEDEDGFVPVDECGAYNNGHFVLNKAKVNELVLELWSD